MMRFTQANFIKPVMVGGRSILSLTEGPGHTAELLDFPIVRVWVTRQPSLSRLTTVFNMPDFEDFFATAEKAEAAKKAEAAANAKPSK